MKFSFGVAILSDYRSEDFNLGEWEKYQNKFYYEKLCCEKG